MDRLIIAGVDVSNVRLVDLTLLADQAKPFYEWVEKQFQQTLETDASLDEILKTSTPQQIQTGIEQCYKPSTKNDLPALFDGIGRTYPHIKACYYFFAW